MIHHVAKVLSVAGKEAILRLIDSETLTLNGSIVNYFHNFADAEVELNKLKAANSSQPELKETSVKFVIVSY